MGHKGQWEDEKRDAAKESTMAGCDIYHSSTVDNSSSLDEYILSASLDSLFSPAAPYHLDSAVS